MNCNSSSTHFRILSLDGGGVHAVSYLSIIKSIEEYLRTSIAVSDEFNMIVGTSTGALVATALKLGSTAEEIVKLYEQSGPKIFTPTKPPGRWVFNKYSSLHLTNAIEQFLDGKGYKDITWRELCSVNEGPELILTLWCISRGETTYVSTDVNKGDQEKLLYQARLSDIPSACCSAPYYFPPRTFANRADSSQDTRDEPVIYCDGGITGLNNPAAFGLARAVAAGVSRNIHLLSLGAGRSVQKAQIADVRRRTSVQAGLSTIEALMDSASIQLHQFQRHLGDRLGVGLYLRTDLTRDVSSKLDDAKAIPNLLQKFKDREILLLAECV